MSKFKKYFDDYSEARKVTDEFNKKHWLGNIVFTLLVYIITFGGFYAFVKIKEKIDEKKMMKQLKKYYEKGEES